MSGGEVWTCISESVIPEYVNTDSWAYYACHNNSNSAPGTAWGSYFWRRGAVGSAVSWITFDEDLVVSRIATSGVGAEPFEAIRNVGVLNEDGSFAYGSSSRYAFYNNIAINPRTLEQFRCTMQHVAELEIVTYFAFNPHWMAAAYRRVPSSYANLYAIGDAVTDEIEDVVPFEINSTNSNFSFGHKFDRTDPRLDVWECRKRIVVRSEELFDRDAAQSILNRLASCQTGSIVGDTVTIKSDFTGAGGDAWSGSYLDVG